MSLFSEATATREELETYIGKKAKSPFYTKVLDTYMKNPNKPIWCWWAFFLSLFWFCYRKALTPTLIIVVAFFTITTMIPLPLSSILTLVILICSGLFGINIYLSSAEKEIARIKEIHGNLGKKTILDAIAKRGGISFNYALVLYISLVLLYSLTFYNLG